MGACTTYVLACAVLLSACLSDICFAQQCNQRGWFGEGCKFQCHCAGNGECSQSGTCSDGCDPEWFGPACQYDVSEYNISGGLADLSWLTDDNDTTCNTDDLESVTVALDTPHPLTWVRVVVSDTALLDQFELSYKVKDSNVSTPCNDSRSARVDNTTVDISCPTTVVVTHVTLSGSIVRGMCSLYISGGRNVALKQTAEQLKTLNAWKADNAVDGNPGIPDDEASLESTCSHTDLGLGDSAYWRLIFSHDVDINRIIIYNRREPRRQNCCEHRLINFTLEALPSSGQKGNFSYTDPGGPAQQVYTVVPTTPIGFPVKTIYIHVRKNRQNDIITLCEVYAFGEVVCLSGKFGRQCERVCNCADQTEACFVSTGGCPSGCAAGYTGEDCHTPCADGTYGPGCIETCSDNCAQSTDICDKFNGTCNGGCKPGYRGPLCVDPCESGTFGSGCSENCSDTCAGPDNACNHENGHCVEGCDPGYKNRTAQCNEECENGTYGSDCAETCSAHCAGEPDVCDFMNGTCYGGCETGYVMPLCTKREGEEGEGEVGEGGVGSSGSDGSDGNDGTLIAAVVGVVAAVIVIVVIVGAFLLWRCRSKKSNHEAENGTVMSSPMETVKTADPESADAADTMKPQAAPRKAKPRSGSLTGESEVEEEYSEEDGRSEISTNIYENETIRHTPVPVEELKAYLHEHSTDSHFKNQFASVPMDTGQSQNNGRLPHNNKKNRYKNIIPYDSTRVRLTTDEKQNLGDYINASYVKDYNDSEIIIASQGPNDAILNDFVRMLWEQNIDRIVMLTNLIEAGKKKCAMYWPESGQKAFGEIKIELLTTRIFAEYIIRHLQLSKGNEPPRDVTQFHFTAWPDKLTPDSPWGLIDFYQTVRTESGTGRLLVHCSAGVGRTGTFIALGSLLKEAEATGKMDFRATLQKMRQYRMHMIQTIAQYIFLHKAVLVGHMTSGTVIKVNDIAARFLSLEGGASGDKSARTYQQEFDDLAAVCDEDIIMPHQQKDEKVQGNNTKSKDRLSNILPNNLYRPLLAAQGGEENKYINAVFVPSLTHNNQDILTQLPLPSTVTDFYRLVTQFEVGLVVAFEIDSKATDETIGDFIPEDDTKPFNNELFEIKTITLSENTALKEMMLIIQKKDEQGPSSSTNPHRLKFLLCKTVSLDPESVLDVAQNIQASRPTQESRIVYMCRNGANLCGLVCIQSILLDRLDVDQTIAVPLVVGAVRAIRPQVIPTVEQYKCLYNVLKLSYETRDVYGNV